MVKYPSKGLANWALCCSKAKVYGPQVYEFNGDQPYFLKGEMLMKWNTLPETNSSHMKMDGWSCFWDGLFSGAFAVSFKHVF